MAGSLRGFVSAARAAFRGRAALVAEAIVLRYQVAVLQRSGTRRPRFRASDRLFWALLSRWWSGWRKGLVLVQPETVLRWRRQGLSLIWSYRSRGRWRGGRPRIAREIRDLIAGMARDNFLWGAPRIHGELLKLGFSVSQATVSRYMPDPRWRRSQSWRTFIRNQAEGIGLSELTGGRSVSDFIGTTARSWLRVVLRRIVGFISDRFANCSQQPARPRALSERRRNGPMSTWATAGAAWAATSSITRRGAELQTANRPRKSLAGARAPPYHVRASPLRRPTGYARFCLPVIYTQPCRNVSRPTRRTADAGPRRSNSNFTRNHSDQVLRTDKDPATRFRPLEGVRLAAGFFVSFDLTIATSSQNTRTSSSAKRIVTTLPLASAGRP